MSGRERRQEWAALYIHRGRTAGELPRYGSPAWLDLPDADPRKVAAVVVAAECWADDLDNLEQRLHDEITASRQVQAEEDAVAFAHVAASVRRHANSPSWDNIVRRWSA